MRLVQMLTLAALGAGLIGAARSAGDDELAARLRSARDTLFAEGAPGSQTSRMNALEEVVAVLSGVAERAELSAAVRTKVTTAHARLGSGVSLLDPAVTGALGEAYAGLNGRPFAFPAEVKTLPQATVICQREMDRALAALDAGRGVEATQALLELLLLVTTPMEAH
jgi:hypothetical protein